MRMMKHTSVNLPEEQLQAIAKTGKSPSEVIRAALDAYFNPVKDVSELIREHERLFHMPDVAHDVRIDVPEIAHTSRIELKDMRETEHETRIIDLPGTALLHILAELEDGKEPTINEVAQHFEISVQTLAKALSPLGIRAQETKRGGKAGRYFTQSMKAKMMEIIQT